MAQLGKRPRTDGPPSPYSVTSSAEPTLARSLSGSSLGSQSEFGDFLGMAGQPEFAIGTRETTRPDAPSSLTRRPKRPFCLFPFLPQQATSLDIPVLRIYLDVTGNVQPGAKQTKADSDDQLIAFVPAMSDETLTQPNIYFMPTVKLTTQDLKAGGSEPMQVLGSFANYKKFLDASKPENPCDPTRPKLFDNVKGNIKYVMDLYFPVGGKIMLPQNVPGSTGVQGFEVYRIDSVSFREMPLPKSSRSDDTRQTVIAELQSRLKDAEEEYDKLKKEFEEGQEASEQAANNLNDNDAELGKLNDELEALEAKTKSSNALVDKLRKRLADQLPGNQGRIGKLQTAVDQLESKYPEPRNERQEAAYAAEGRSLNSQLSVLLRRQENLEFYLDDATDWSQDTAYRPGATELMKEYGDAKRNQYELNQEKERKLDEVEKKRNLIREVKGVHNANQQQRREAKRSIEFARQELFKSQEQLNAVKGGWQIDRAQAAADWWVVTNDGFAFPRAYTIILDLRVSYVGDAGEGEDTFWGLDCVGKAQSIDKRLKELMGRNPDAPFKVFEDFIKAYNPPWSPFAAPAAFTSYGRRTADTPGSREAQAELRQRRRLDMHAAQQRAAQQALRNRGGPANPQQSTYITLEALQALGVPGIQPPAAQGQPQITPVPMEPVPQPAAPPQQPAAPPVFQFGAPAPQPMFDFGSASQQPTSSPPQSPLLSPASRQGNIASRVKSRVRGAPTNPFDHPERWGRRRGGKRTRKRKSKAHRTSRYKRRHSRRKPSTK